MCTPAPTSSSADKRGLLPANLININYSGINNSECCLSSIFCGAFALCLVFEAVESLHHRSESSSAVAEGQTSFLMWWSCSAKLTFSSLLFSSLLLSSRCHAGAKCPVELTFLRRWLTGPLSELLLWWVSRQSPLIAPNIASCQRTHQQKLQSVSAGGRR